MRKAQDRLKILEDLLRNIKWVFGRGAAAKVGRPDHVYRYELRALGNEHGVDGGW